MLVLSTFIGAVIAGLGTEATYFFGFITAQTHQLRSGVAECSTLHIQLYAPGHHLYILFFEAGTCTMVANCSAGKAGVYTFPVFMISHSSIFHKLLYLMAKKFKKYTLNTVTV